MGFKRCSSVRDQFPNSKENMLCNSRRKPSPLHSGLCKSTSIILASTSCPREPCAATHCLCYVPRKRSTTATRKSLVTTDCWRVQASQWYFGGDQPLALALLSPVDFPWSSESSSSLLGSKDFGIFSSLFLSPKPVWRRWVLLMLMPCVSKISYNPYCKSRSNP